MVNYEKIVTIIREIAPQLSLDKVIEDIEKAVESIGISVKYSDMTHLETRDISGYVRVINGIPEIIVNSSDIEQRRRFTIAHELGHIFLHWGWLPGEYLSEGLVEVSYRNGKYTEEELKREREADKFAAEFLAPKKEVERSLRCYEENGVLDKEKQIELLAEEYKVSNQMAYRLWFDNRFGD